MSDTLHLFPLKDQPLPVQMIVSAMVVLFSGIVFILLFLLAGTLMFRTDLSEILLVAQGRGGENTDLIFKYLQSVQSISLFIIPALIISFMMTLGYKNWLLARSRPSVINMLLVTLLAFALIPVTSLTGILNAKMQLPGWLGGVEKWISEKEDMAAYLTGILLESNNIATLIVNLVVIAIIPAISEELFFRGVVQQIFQKMFRSASLGIWIGAIVFSSIHLQFYGFLPRLILGLVFGYLFYWGGTLWLPVTAHFVNNAVPVISSYLNGVEKYDFRNAEFSETGIGAAIIGSIICLGVLFLIRRGFLIRRKTA